MPPELKWAEPLSRCAIVQPNSKSCLLTYLNQKKIIENAFLCKEVEEEEDCLTVTRGSFKIAFSFAETRIIMTPSVQCDQIRRNFATMSKLKNNLPIFYVLYSIGQIFIVAKWPHIQYIIYPFGLTVFWQKEKGNTWTHKRLLSFNTQTRCTKVESHFGPLGPAAYFWPLKWWFSGNVLVVKLWVRIRHHSEKKLNNRDHFCKTHLMSQMLTLYLATWPSKETIIF